MLKLYARPTYRNLLRRRRNASYATTDSNATQRNMPAKIDLLTGVCECCRRNQRARLQRHRGT